MHLAEKLIAFGLAGFLGIGISEAQNRLPDQLSQAAPVICSGLVLSVEGERPDGGGNSRLLAKIEVLHVFKGSAPSQIEFLYWIHGAGYQYLDGQDKVDLQKGERGRFFLRPSVVKGQYIGELEAEHDPFDMYDVEQLSASEADDNPFLSEKDAWRIAEDYLKSTGVVVPPGYGRVTDFSPGRGKKGASWLINFYSEGQTHSSFCVDVTMDGKVDPAWNK